MEKPSTRLVLDNASGKTLVTLTMRMNEGQFMELCLLLSADPNRSIHGTERAVLQHARAVIDHMLQT